MAQTKVPEAGDQRSEQVAEQIAAHAGQYLVEQQPETRPTAVGDEVRQKTFDRREGGQEIDR